MSTAAIPTREPSSFSAGDSVSWTKSLSDYLPADGWSLLYCFRGKSLTKLDVTSTTSGSDHLVSIGLEDSAGLVAGTYDVVGYAVKPTTDRVQIFIGKIIVTPNFQTLDEGADTRSQNRRTLDNINAVIEGRASSTILNSSVEGTNIQRIPHADLLLLRDRYAVLVANEENALAVANGKPNRKIVLTRFTTPR